MHTIHARNVIDALSQGVRLINECGVLKPSRNGDTLEVPEPVSTTYIAPNERVLFDKDRDANPFFHLFEALWMLAGRNDVAFPAMLVKRMAVYSDDGLTFNGAYGFRWRSHFGYDQLKDCIEQLSRDSDTRRCVLTMWDPRADLRNQASKDLPCNVAVFFKVRSKHLDMTVVNRSNDMLLGAYGANAVHMSMLQEYVASHLGVALGYYTQMSDSFHVYLDRAKDGPSPWAKVKDWPTTYTGDDRYRSGEVNPSPLLDHGLRAADMALFDMDLSDFFDAADMQSSTPRPYRTGFFNRVVTPMWSAFHQRAPHLLTRDDIDWHVAGREWLLRRGP